LISQHAAPRGPLSGKIILDCSVLLPGPFVGKLLAEQGARVLKIENPARPDPSRQMGVFHDVLNGAKELIWLDITSDEDRPKFHALVREAHGLIEGFRPAAKKRLGLDSETLHAINPSLCISSIIGWPEDGPDSNRAGHDLNFQARSGMLSLFNEMPALPFADLFASWQAALNLSSALVSQAQGAHGIRMVSSMSGALEEAQSLLKAQFVRDGKLPVHGSNLFSGQHPCYRLYRAKCGRRIACGAIERKFWNSVCAILGTPHLEELGLSTGKQAEGVSREISERFASAPWTHWAPLFEAANCCVEPVLDYSEI
jgi:alpha-methylacyl-CoA racemase